MESLFIWFVVILMGITILIPYLLKFRKEQKVFIERRKEAVSLGITQPRAQYPFIDISACIGCGSCVAACPESDVLGIVYGKAMLINGLRCVGHGSCEQACPVSALKVGLGDITTRADIPILDKNYQSNVPGLFVVGELGGLSLIRNAINQGRTAIERIAQDTERSDNDEIKDIIIIGAGPAGLTAALTATKHKLSYVVLDQQPAGGTILQYPRRKLVMNKPVGIPLYGQLSKTEYSKESLLDIWNEIIAKFDVKIEVGPKIENVQNENGLFVVSNKEGHYHSRYVVLAMGRRGSPRKLNVPGENLSKVSYQLLDAQSYSKTNILVVGGGDSAVEAAIGLARQKGNKVFISYRKPKFFRIKMKNEKRINTLIKEKRILPIFDSNVEEITRETVRIRTEESIIEIPNDYVFIFAGGVPPFKMLKKMGITFGGEMRSLIEN